MSDPWVRQFGTGVTIVIDRDALSDTLAQFAPDLNAVAEEVAAGARDVLPNDEMKKFIGVKAAGGRSGDNPGMWRLNLRGRRYGSGTGDRLMRGVEVPVALVTNNSRLAVVWEYGGIPQEKVGAYIKGSRGRIGRGGITNEDYARQWQPLTLGAQRARARLVLKKRRVSG